MIRKTREDNSFELKKKKLAQKKNKNLGLVNYFNLFNKESEIIDKLLKYCSKDVKSQIISERIIERYKDKDGYD